MDTPITTTLSAIRSHSPCEDVWEKLLKHLGKTKADDEPLAFSTILESNGVDYALCCLRSLPEECHPRMRLMAADFAERVLPIFEKEYPNDGRPRKAIEAVRAFARGEITETEMASARAAAMASNRAAARAANKAATWDAAMYAARAAAMAANRAASWAAVRDAVRDAAMAANRAASWAAVRDAVRDAARAAAMAAAMYASWDAAGYVAGDAEREAQGELLIKYFG